MFHNGTRRKIDYFVTQIRNHASKYDFSEEELQQRVIKLIIKTTYSEEYQICTGKVQMLLVLHN